jgi:RNA polymerase sigma-70 factor, ECF subfamily
MVSEALSDFELIKKTNMGETNAFSILVQRYSKTLLQLSYRYVRDPFLAEDIVQDSFLKAFEKLSTFQFRSSFKSWIYRIVINTAKNFLRGTKSIVNIDNVQLKVESLIEINMIESQLLKQAKDIIDSMPEKQQQAIELRVFEDLSFQEVADQMDCPYDTAKANYRHGLIKLREKMVINW